MNRYRYILNGVATGEYKICDFRLIAGNNIKPSYNGTVALRVSIPIDLKLNKESCDIYSTTEDQRTIDELGYDILVWYKKERRWKIHNEFNEFKGVKPCDIRLR